jgi:deazaflavin-dependent oxidoreductase (nitroreductase family)
VTLRASIPRFNRRVINPIARKFAGRVPPFSLLEHAGRISGTRYQTPIMAFRSGNDIIIALTYGPSTDWVRNVIAAGGCTIEYRRRRITLSNPRIEHGAPVDKPLPWLVQRALTVMNVSDFLLLERVQQAR